MDEMFVYILKVLRKFDCATDAQDTLLIYFIDILNVTRVTYPACSISFNHFVLKEQTSVGVVTYFSFIMLS
jgi:hypothetical protein